MISSGSSFAPSLKPTMFNPAAAIPVLLGALVHLPLRQMRPREADALPVPLISVGKGSLSGFGIANNMRRFFQDGGKPRTKENDNDDEDVSFIGDEVRNVRTDSSLSIHNE